MGLNQLIKELSRMKRIEISLTEAFKLTQRALPLLVNIASGEGIYSIDKGYLVITGRKAFVFQ